MRGFILKIISIWDLEINNFQYEGFLFYMANDGKWIL